MPQSGKTTVDSDKWGWKHVSVKGGFNNGSGTKKWKCNYCNHPYNGSYSRVRAHLLGFAGFGIKSCPQIDTSLRHSFLELDQQQHHAQNPKKSSLPSSNKNCKIVKTLSKQDVDDAVARFFYAEGLNMNTVTSPYFQEMTNAIAVFGQGYELPSAEKLSDSSLSNEKVKVERVVGLIRQSWTHTGCTVLCVNHLDCSISCFCINFFVASPRGVVFLKSMDVNERDSGADNTFITYLSDTINEVGPENVVQVITHLGQVGFAFEPVILSNFPNLFWSHCASHSIIMLMEEIAEIESIKTVILHTKGINLNITNYQTQNVSQDLLTPYDTVHKFAPYDTIHNLCGIKQALRNLVVGHERKQWKLNLPEDSVTYENLILDNDFWVRAELILNLFEPLLTLSTTLNIDKSVMGDVYNWRVQSLEALRSKVMIDEITLNQLEIVIETRWDSLFSPLHAAGYILNPKYFGKGQNKDKFIMHGWNATLERYTSESEERRMISEQLNSYWRSEGLFGDEDAIESRDKMDPVAWWDNFGFETPRLRILATKVLSQVSSVSAYEGNWLCKESVSELGVNRTDEFLFVQNNLKLQSGDRNNSSCFGLCKK